jgi:HSP20 family protein
MSAPVGLNQEVNMSKSVIPVGTDRPGARREANPFAFLQQEIDRLFEGLGGNFPVFAPSRAALPRMDVSETDKVIEVTAELPGLEAKDIKLDLTNNILTIRGEKKSDREEKDKDYHLIERSFGSFSRSVQLPDGVNAEDVSAEIAKGVLTVTIKKPAARAGKQIEIKSAA